VANTTELNGTPTLDEQLQALRQVYMQGVSDIIDRCLDELVLPAQKEAMIQDAAQFVLFLLAIKVAEVRGLGLERQQLLAAYWPLEKLIKKELPGMLLQFARERGAGGQG
jgi:hypothetical protein